MTLVPQSNLILSDSQPLTRDQKTFNRLIQQIETRRIELTEWQEVVPEFRKRVSQDLHPLLEKEKNLKIKLAERLDQAHSQKGATKTERKKLSAFIIQLAINVLDLGHTDEAIKALYNKHTDSDFDAEENARMEEIKSMMEESLGMELGDDFNGDSPEEILARLKMRYEAEQEAGRNAFNHHKTAKEQAREAKLEAEAKKLSHSIREVYRKLASALHPDRETDPEEQLRKTSLMQKANEAYERGNLLELLELQLQLEQIDSAHLINLSTDRLKNYIKILKDQVRELDTEIQTIKHQIIMEFGLNPYQKITTYEILLQLKLDVANTKFQLKNLQELIDMTRDPIQLKAWLKTMRL